MRFFLSFSFSISERMPNFHSDFYCLAVDRFFKTFFWTAAILKTDGVYVRVFLLVSPLIPPMSLIPIYNVGYLWKWESTWADDPQDIEMGYSYQRSRPLGPFSHFWIFIALGTHYSPLPIISPWYHTFEFVDHDHSSLIQES